MRARTRIAAFAALLVGVFVGTALLGGAIDPSASDAGEEHGVRVGHGDTGATPGHSGSAESKASTDDHNEGTIAAAPPGLQIEQDGHRLVVNAQALYERPAARTVRVQIVDVGGRPVREFDLAHEKRMHFIVVRRDLTSFQHLHPTMSPDGTWTVRMSLPTGGVYRVFADFTRAGEQRTLGADVHVDGSYRPEAPPRPQTTTRTDDGLAVSLDTRSLEAGEASLVEFEVRKDGRVVTDQLRPYLGAKGHLVALRDGDLAYLHSHPEDDRLSFTAEYPSAGSYRLFVQFLYEGRIQTAVFTQEVPQ